MTIRRRDFLTFIGGIGGAMLLDVGSRDRLDSKFSMPFMESEENSESLAATSSLLNFKPIKGPMPLVTDAIAP